MGVRYYGIWAETPPVQVETLIPADYEVLTAFKYWAKQWGADIQGGEYSIVRLWHPGKCQHVYQSYVGLQDILLEEVDAMLDTASSSFSAAADRIDEYIQMINPEVKNV